MKSHTLRLSLDCNQRCRFCFAEWPDSQSGESNFTNLVKKDYESELDYFFEKGYELLSISGGEPTIHKDIIKIIKYAKSKGFKEIELQTNATLLNESNVKKLKNAGMTRALVSFHSHIPEIFDKITRSKGHFNSVLKGIQNLIKYRIPVTLIHVICSLNYQNLPELADFLEKEVKGIHEILFFYVQPEGRAKDNEDIMPKLSEVSPYWYDCLKNFNNLGIKFRIDSQCGVPLCYMEGYEDMIHLSDIKNPEKVFGDDMSSFEYMQKNKTKPGKCKTCFFTDVCFGFWTEYIDKHGAEELIPVKENSNLTSMFPWIMEKDYPK